MTVINRFFGLLIVASLLFACSAEDGEDGAIGPQGPAGAQGPAGIQGEQGELGAANVIYSDWIPSGIPSNILSNQAAFDVDAPLLTDEIINSGVILVYGRFSLSLVYGLPVTFNSGVFNESHFYRTEGVGKLSIRINSLDGSDIVERLFGDYRYVLIPGGVLSGKSVTPDYTKMTYDEITKLFNIPR